jgi:hypothetical protein
VTFNTQAGEQEKTMKKASAIRSVILGAVMLAYGAGAFAQAVSEVEPNYPASAAQPLVFDVTGTAMVSAFLGNGDADLYSFWAKEGDIITVDIDGGVKAGPGSVDTFVSVHQTAALNYMVMRGVDDATALDPGSLGTEDSYIANLRIPADGVYLVSVAGYPNRVADGAVLSGGPGNTTGTYTLIVTGVSPAPVAEAPAPVPVPETPAPPPVAQPPAIPEAPAPEPVPPVIVPPAPLVMQVSIDVKPGQRGMARINPKSKHEIPVALLSSSEFDVRKVDVTSLTFGRTGDEASLDKCFKHMIRVNRDRRRDLVCQFENHLAGFEPSDEEGVLKGKMEDGTPFEGRGMLKVISEKRKSSHSKHDHNRGRHQHHNHR